MTLDEKAQAIANSPTKLKKRLREALGVLSRSHRVLFSSRLSEFSFDEKRLYSIDKKFALQWVPLAHGEAQTSTGSVYFLEIMR